MDVDSFVRDGFVAVRRAVDARTVAACRKLTWAEMGRRGIRQEDRGTWCPLAEMSGLSGEPFVAAYMAPALTGAYDELIGPGRWKPSVDIGEALVGECPLPGARTARAFPAHRRRAGPRIIAQPAINAPAGFALDGTDPSPVARAIVNGLATTD
jgi:hypothetical protein